MPRIQLSEAFYWKLVAEGKNRGMELEELLLWLYRERAHTDAVDLQVDRRLVDSVALFLREHPELGYQSVEDFVRDSVRRFLFSRASCRSRI